MLDALLFLSQFLMVANPLNIVPSISQTVRATVTGFPGTIVTRSTTVTGPSKSLHQTDLTPKDIIDLSTPPKSVLCPSTKILRPSSSSTNSNPTPGTGASLEGAPKEASPEGQGGETDEKRFKEKKGRKMKGKDKTELKTPNESMNKAQLVSSMRRQHPLVCLRIGTLSANTRRALGDGIVQQQGMNCVRDITKQALMTKRNAQEFLGYYI